MADAETAMNHQATMTCVLRSTATGPGRRFRRALGADRAIPDVPARWRAVHRAEPKSSHPSDPPVASNGFHARMSPDGAQVAVFDEAALVEYEPDPARLPTRLIDLASGRQTAALEGFTDYAADVAFTPDGTHLASWHLNGVLIVWDVSGSEPRMIATFPTGTVGSGRIAFLPDGRTLIAETPGVPTWFHLTDTSSGAVTAIMGPTITSYAGFLDATRPGPAFDLQYSAMTVSPDGTTLATASFNGEVAVWRDSGRTAADDPCGGYPRIGRADIRQLAFVGGSDALWWYDRSDELTHVWDVATCTESGSLGVGGFLHRVPRVGAARMGRTTPTTTARASVSWTWVGRSPPSRSPCSMGGLRPVLRRSHTPRMVPRSLSGASSFRTGTTRSTSSLHPGRRLSASMMRGAGAHPIRAT